MQGAIDQDTVTDTEGPDTGCQQDDVEEVLCQLRNRHAISDAGGSSSVKSTIGIVVGGKTAGTITMVKE
jgi:hypothetical protein